MVTTLSAETSLLPSCCRQTCSRNEYTFRQSVCRETGLLPSCCRHPGDKHWQLLLLISRCWQTDVQRLTEQCNMVRRVGFCYTILLQSEDKRVQWWSIFYTNNVQTRVCCHWCCGQIRTIKTDNNRQSYRMKTTCWRQVARKTCARLHGRKLRLEERRVCYYHVADTNRLKTIYLLHHQTKFCCHCVTGNLSNRLTKFGNTRRDVIFLLTDMLQTNVYEDRQQSAKH